MSRVLMTLPQKIEAAKLLDLHMVEINGGFAYADEWSDARIANMVGTAAAPVKARHVASVRTELKGALPRKPSPVIATSAGELDLDAIKNTINKAIKSHAVEANAAVDHWSKINTEIADRKFSEQNARIATFEKTIVALAEKISELAGEVDGKIKTEITATIDAKLIRLDGKLAAMHRAHVEGEAARTDDRLNSLAVRFARLCEHLTINRVTNVRHLGIIATAPPDDMAEAHARAADALDQRFATNTK